MATSPDTTNYGRGFQTPGLGSAGAYQVSGFPYVTGSGLTPLAAGATKEIVFPSVTKFITLMPVNTAGAAGFNPVVSFADPSNARVQSQGHTISFPTYDSAAHADPAPYTFEVKCSRIWVKEVGGASGGGFTVVAGLTSINPGSMYDLSGSGINE